MENRNGLKMVMKRMMKNKQGEIENGKPNGQGTLTSPDADKYEGEWKDGKYHGQGTYTLTDGNRFEGEWKDGKKLDGWL